MVFFCLGGDDLGCVEWCFWVYFGGDLVGFFDQGCDDVGFWYCFDDFVFDEDLFFVVV